MMLYVHLLYPSVVIKGNLSLMSESSLYSDVM